MSGVINKVKNAMHSDNTTTTGTHAGTHTTGTTHSGVPEGTAGPHGSRAANAADPRIDSDLDGRGTTHGTTHTGTTGTTGNYTTGSSGLTGSHTGTSGLTGTSHGTHNNTTGHTAGVSGVGPHSNATANKLDPRVDSDVSHVRGTDHTIGSNPHTTTHTGGLTGHASNIHSSTGTHGSSGLTGTHPTGGVTGHSSQTPHTTGVLGAGHSTNTTAGPHKSNLLNKADPTVDSDLSKTHGHAHAPGAQSTHNNAGLPGSNTHTTGTHTGTHTTGTHTGTNHGITGSHATPGSGNAKNTAGPHNSDLLNKLDPRVDSDLDGSKTIGGNKTHTDTTSYAHKDVLDASQVPPSVFAAHKGEPEILHGDHTHDRAGRHGSLSHQEKHSGI